MKSFSGTCDPYVILLEDGSLNIEHKDVSYIVLKSAREARELVRLLNMAIDEAEPEGDPDTPPLEIPERPECDAIYARVNDAQKAPFSPKETKIALGNLALQVGNLLDRHYMSS